MAPPVQHRYTRLTAIVVVVVTACGGSGTSTTVHPVTTPAPTTTVDTRPTTAGPTTTGAEPVTTTAGPTTTGAEPVTTTAPTTLPPNLSPPRVIEIPLGPDTIEYRQGGTDMEATGPALFAISDRGAVFIADPVGNRLMVIEGDGTRFVDLAELDVLGVTAMAADGEDLLLVEVFFAPLRQRLHRLDTDGRLLDTVDLPAGFRLEDGLSGVHAGAGGDALLEFAGGEFYARFDAATSTIGLDAPPVAIRGVDVEPRPPDVAVDGVVFEADLTTGAGALRYVGTATDGTHVIERNDVTAFAPAIEVIRTIEWYRPDGDLIGSALVPSLEVQAIGAAPGIAMTADGRVYTLLALETHVEVRELERQPGRILG